MNNEQIEKIILELQSHSGVPFFNSIRNQLLLGFLLVKTSNPEEILNKYMQIIHSIRNIGRINPNIKSYDW